jgi:hypothetical protein
MAIDPAFKIPLVLPENAAQSQGGAVGSVLIAKAGALSAAVLPLCAARARLKALGWNIPANFNQVSWQAFYDNPTISPPP